MLLQEYFKALEKTAFGPWLAKYKKFFTQEELDKDKLVVENELKEKDRDCKIVILSNDVVKTPKDKLFSNTIATIDEHIIGKVFTEITNTQLQEFSQFILNLPKDNSDYKEYFVIEESKDGYSKIDAFKKIPEKDKLVAKFSQSKNQEHNNNYQEISQKTEILLKYLNYSVDPEIMYIGEEAFQQCDHV